MVMAAERGRQVRAGLVGDGIQGSSSPAIHEAEGAAHGLELSYVRFDLADPAARGTSLEDVLDRAERDGFVGLNVTYPYKQAIIPLLDRLSADAERLGAVNTVVFQAGRRVGYNTDWIGFRESFRQTLGDAPRRSVLQLGAGGAGVAVAYALLASDVERLAIFDVDQARAGELVQKLAGLFGAERVSAAQDVRGAIAGVDGLVNATPIGMTRHPGSPVPANLLRPQMWVADIVYVPIETQLLRDARRVGCRTMDGGGMVVFQAAEAFRLFTGLAANAGEMRSRFLSALAANAPSASEPRD